MAFSKTDNPWNLSDEVVQLGRQVASAGSQVVARYFRQRKSYELFTKEDRSPVTDVDREAEQAMRTVIQEQAPLELQRVLGEELSSREAALSSEGYLWVLDPIDGTKAFLCGKPTFATLVALVHNGEPVMGIIEQPFIGERWLGVRGKPTLWNDRPIQTNQENKSLSKAVLSATTPDMFQKSDYVRFFDGLVANVWQIVYGCDSYAYGLLAAGHLDLVAEADLKPWDFMALVPIVTGAGGVITDWNGHALDLHSDGHVLAAANEELHEHAIAALRYPLGPELLFKDSITIPMERQVVKQRLFKIFDALKSAESMTNCFLHALHGCGVGSCGEWALEIKSSPITHAMQIRFSGERLPVQAAYLVETTLRRELHRGLLEVHVLQKAPTTTTWELTQLQEAVDSAVADILKSRLIAGDWLVREMRLLLDEMERFPERFHHRVHALRYIVDERKATIVPMKGMRLCCVLESIRRNMDLTDFEAVDLVQQFEVLAEQTC
jgi:histidinol phosphatase-like enzyme (inositol monophosphatase family)